MLGCKCPYPRSHFASPNYFFILILWITATQLGIGRDSQNCLELGLSVESTSLLIYRLLLPAMVELNSHRFAHLYHFLISMIKVSAV